LLQLGLGSLPPERTNDAVVGAFATAAQYAEFILIQRTPPWEDFLPGGQESRATTNTTRLETGLLKQYHALGLFYAIDPTDGAVQRTRIANLPGNIDPQAGFADPALRNAFLAYTAYVAKNYNPAYLAIGVEVNMMYERNTPAQFESFVSLYKEAYDVAKGANPKIKVFPTFQLEVIEGSFGAAHPPHWEVLDAFRTKMDVLAISTYPYLGDARNAAEIRGDYFSQLRQRFKGEIIIAETGYASAPVEGRVNAGTEEDQLAYTQRLLADAERSGFTLVVWTPALDPAFARGGTANSLRDSGLRRSDGSNKLAWTTWEDWVRRPFKRP